MDQAKNLKRIPLLLTVLMTVAFAVFFTWFDLGRHAKTNSGRFDLGNAEQVLWNVTHGYGFTMTDPYGTAQVSRLAFHADVFWLVLAPIYALIPRTETLLILQVLVVASGAFAAYLLARRMLTPWWGMMFSAVYLLQPGLHWSTIFDVHAVTFATPLILWAIVAAQRRGYWWMLAAAMLAVSTKENIGLLVPAIGLYLWIWRHERRWGPIMTFIPLLWSLKMFFIILPAFHGQTTGGNEVYRSVFGPGATNVVTGIFQHPLTFLKTLFASYNLTYLWHLLATTGGLAIGSLWSLAAVPEFIINALSLKPAQHLFIAHYTSGLTPWLIAGSIFTVAWVRRRFTFPGKDTVIALWLGGWLIFSVWTLSPLPRTPNDQTKFVTWRNVYAAPVRTWAANIPASAAVSVTNNVGSQFARRQFLYSFPLGVERSQYVVVLKGHATPVVASQAAVTTAVQQLRADPHWEVLEQRGELTVLHRR